jgi:hypothetical protein
VPTAVGVYVTEQLVGEVAPASTHDVAGVNVPAPVDENVTDPVGGVGLPLLSVTVAVHVESCPTTRGDRHRIVVVVAWTVAVNVAVTD